jgi:hypothetical protein
MSQEEWVRLATELLNFIEGTFEDEAARHAYRLQRTKTFLEMKFGHVPALQKEVEALRKWEKAVMPMVGREMRDPPIRDPFSYHPDQGDD